MAEQHWTPDSYHSSEWAAVLQVKYNSVNFPLYAVTDRINGATDDRVNGASKTWSFSLLDGVNFGLFFTLFFSLFLYPPGSFLASDNSCRQG